MSSKRDLVEAHSFNRRRLVTAFTSGAPGGREVEAPRHGRTLLGGAVLAVLVIVGAAITGVFKPTVPDGWDQNGLVIGKESGSRFFAQDGRLYPVINTTSARLLTSPDDEFKVRIVPDAKIAEKRPGATIGILGAPDVLPASDKLIDTGWTACIDSADGWRMRVAPRPLVRALPESALVARVDGATWVVADGHRYALPAALQSAVLDALGLSDPPRDVDARWLTLFPEGTALAPVDVPGQKTPTKLAGLPESVQRVGALVTVDGDPYVVLAKGLASITDVERKMMQASPNAVTPVPVPITSGDRTQAGLVVTSPFDHVWPHTVSESFGDPTACALLDARAGELPSVSLGVATGDAARPGAGVPRLEIEDGHGAVVRALEGHATDEGTRFLVDTGGTSYAIGDGADAQWRLGYREVEPTVVPSSWLNLFLPGPSLSTAQARLAVRSGG
jgi:type VII secretion protein EccB